MPLETALNFRLLPPCSDPYTAHFISPDSIVPPGVQGLDRYAYANNSPIVYSDPSGHMVSCDLEATNGCGHISTTSEIFIAFDSAHSRNGGIFAEYYATLHEANVAISTHDPNADSVAASAAAARERAMAYLPQKDFNPALLIPPDAILKFSQAIVSFGKEVGGVAAGIIFSSGSSNQPQINIQDEQFGQKLGKHASDFGLNPGIPEDREAFRRLIVDAVNNPDEIRTGLWRGSNNNHTFYRQGNTVVVLDSQGNFVTILNNGINNSWFAGAKP